MKVHLFTQCMIDMFYPQIGMDAVQVLEHLGCELIVPEKQVCCGQMFSNEGYDSVAKDAIKKTIEVFEDANYVVSLSGSCAFAIRDEYHKILQEEPEWLERASRLSKKIYEFTEFIVNILGVTDVGAHFDEKVTYHKSCHATRLMGIKEPPLKLLAGVKDLKYIELDKADRCCGFGGTFAVTYPEISEAIVREKVMDIYKSGANVVAGIDQACLMNISGMLDRLYEERVIDKKIKAMHIAQILNQR